MDGNKNLTQITIEGNITYTTMQNRIMEMKRLKLITIHDEVDKNSKRP
jgi:hypothetical protein